MVACFGAALCWILLASNPDPEVGGATFGLLFFGLGFWSGGFNLIYALVTARNPLEHAGTVTAYINVGIFVGSGVIQSLSTNSYVATSGDFSEGLSPMVVGSLTAVLLSLSLFRATNRVSARP